MSRREFFGCYFVSFFKSSKLFGDLEVIVCVWVVSSSSRYSTFAEPEFAAPHGYWPLGYPLSYDGNRTTKMPAWHRVQVHGFRQGNCLRIGHQDCKLQMSLADQFLISRYRLPPHVSVGIVSAEELLKTVYLICVNIAGVNDRYQNIVPSWFFILFFFSF